MKKMIACGWLQKAKTEAEKAFDEDELKSRIEDEKTASLCTKIFAAKMYKGKSKLDRQFVWSTKGDVLCLCKANTSMN